MATTVLNARAAYTAGPVTLFGYVRNVFDNFYLTYLFSPTLGTAGDPRESASASRRGSKSVPGGRHAESRSERMPSELYVIRCRWSGTTPRRRQ